MMPIAEWHSETIVRSDANSSKRLCGFGICVSYMTAFRHGVIEANYARQRPDELAMLIVLLPRHQTYSGSCVQARYCDTRRSHILPAWVPGKISLRDATPQIFLITAGKSVGF